MKKLIIIPAYNESANIKKTIADIRNNAEGFDYVVINDCSTDNTREILEENGYNYIDLPINLGIGGAVQTGYKYAYENDYDMAVQVDGDGQHDVAFLNDMAKELVNRDADMVIGSRFIDKEGFQSTAMRRIGIVYFSTLLKILTGKRITDPTSGMRMAGKKVIKRFAAVYPADYPETESTMEAICHNLKVVEIPVVMRERQGGKSSIFGIKSLYFMIKVTLAVIVERFRSRKEF